MLKTTRKRHGIHPATRTYSPRVCAICGVTFAPHDPRSKQCYDCQSVKCIDCGCDISASVKLHRARTSRTRRCMACHLACEEKPIAGKRVEAPVGTRRINKSGYVAVKCADGEWRLEHRIVAEQKIGRSLRPGEQVHHVDGDTQNNSPDNLEVCAGLRDHLDRFHAEDLKNPPLHHNGRKRPGDPGYVPIPKAVNPGRKSQND